MTKLNLARFLKIASFDQPYRRKPNSSRAVKTLQEIPGGSGYAGHRVSGSTKISQRISPHNDMFNLMFVE